MGTVFYLPDVVRVMDQFTPDPRAYLNRRTGELFEVTEEDLATAQSGDDPVGPHEEEVVPKLREVLRSEDWLELPVRYTELEIGMMERFALAATNCHARGEMLFIARGPDPIMLFGEVLIRWGIREDYYRYRDQELSREAEAWLQDRGIAYRK